MKRYTISTLQLTTLLAFSVNAQSPTSTNGPAGVTSFSSFCPTDTTTTITLPTTITLCPGPNCNGGARPVITPPPVGPARGGLHLGEFTSVGPDGKTTILGLYETVLDAMGDDGMTQVTYTITEPCPSACHKTMDPNVLPAGFETTVVPCHVCEKTGGPTTITLTQPCSTGPYASQTPSTTSAPVSPATPSANPEDSDNDSGVPVDAQSSNGADGSESSQNLSGAMDRNGTSSPTNMVYLGSSNRLAYSLSTMLFGALGWLALC